MVARLVVKRGLNFQPYQIFEGNAQKDDTCTLQSKDVLEVLARDEDLKTTFVCCKTMKR